MLYKKFTFAVSNRRKCIENLRTQPMHFREDFGKYRTQKVMNVIVKECQTHGKRMYEWSNREK